MGTVTTVAVEVEAAFGAFRQGGAFSGLLATNSR